jgi:hypothetical protein
LSQKIPAIKSDSFSLSWLALVTGLAPLLVVHIAFFGSVLGEYVPLCNPYLDGCASISASGRHGFSYVFFKVGMIPAAFLLAAFWLVCWRWLLQLGEDSSAMLCVMIFSGVISAVFLILYTIYLGSRGEFYQFMRRTGVVVYFSFSYLAQLVLLARLQKLQQRRLVLLPPYILQGKLIIVSGLMVFGLASIPVGNFIADKDRLENIVEWWFALTMVSYYFFTWQAWRHTGVALRVSPKVGIICTKKPN